MFFCGQRSLDMDNRLDSGTFSAQPNLSCFSKKDISFSPEMRYNKFEVCASIFSHTTEREFCCGFFLSAHRKQQNENSVV